MKICLVTTSFPRWAGDGQGTFVWELARFVASFGVEMLVISMHSPGARRYERMENIEIIRPRYWLPEKWEMLKRMGGGLPVTWRKYPLARIQILPFFLVYALSIIRYARFCDLIHAHWTLSAAAASFGQPIHQRRILLTVQGSDIFQVPQHPIGAVLTRATLSRCDLIVALSKALETQVIQLGVEPSKLRVIPNGVDTSQFAPLDIETREPLILFVGSLIQRKGVKYLIQAMPDVFASFPDFRLIIVGEGPEAPFLQALTRELKIENRTLFTGLLPHQEVRNLMQRAKALILPSLEEGMGVVLVEALACGTPVVASCVDGIRDIITPDVGILVPPADSEALSRGIIEMLSNSTYWTEMSRNARRRAEIYYDWRIIARRYIQLYQALVG